MKVFINPGHAPDRYVDPGAVNSRRGLCESEIAAQIGTRVAGHLRAVGYDVILHQNESLEGICRAANASGANIFVSIHCNAFDGKARGTEAYCARGSGYGRELASCINEQLAASVPVSNRASWNRGVKTAGFYVLMNTDMPAALIETAFIDNDYDADLLCQFEDVFARAIARGITDYFAI